MTPEAMARLHGLAMETRAWGADEFRDFLNAGAIFAGDEKVFALGRLTLDELEVLTVATHPDHRRQGLAHSCMTAVHLSATAKGAALAFLEVSAANAAARALYEALGYTQVGLRRDYYRIAQNRFEDAIVMAKRL